MEKVDLGSVALVQSDILILSLMQFDEMRAGSRAQWQSTEALGLRASTTKTR